MRKPGIFLCGALAAACLVAGCEDAPAAEKPTLSTVPPEPAVETVTPAELRELVDKKEVVLIDVRTPEEFASGRIPGALNAPIETFDPAAIPLEKDRETILYCRSGRRSAMAAERLSEHVGKPVRHLEGGILAWQKPDTRPVEK